LGTLEFRPGVFQVIGRIGAADDICGQAALGLEAGKRLERRGRQHAAKIPDHRLDHFVPPSERKCWRAANMECTGKPALSALGGMNASGYFCSMKFAKPFAAVVALLSAVPAQAIVGGGAPASDGVARSIVTIVGSRGNFCTGSVIAPTIVLTAAHCVQPGAEY